MKKIALVLAVVMIITALFTLSAGADLREMKNGTQQKIGSVKVNPDYAPTVNGEVLPGEYSVSYKYDQTSDKIVINGGCPMEYVETHFAHTDEKLYMAFVVQEDEYKTKGNPYSKVWIEMGFRFEDSMDAAMTKFGLTISINDDGSEFAGLGFYEFAENSMGQQTPTSWAWLNKGWDERSYKRSVDANGKNITIYEYSLDFAAIYEAFGIEKVEDFYIRWSVVPLTADGGAIGNFVFGVKPDPEQSIECQIQYGWCPTTLPHIFGLYDTKAEMESDIAEFDAANKPPVVTDPPVVETDPPIVETDPPVVETDPPVVETDPPVVETDPATPTDPVTTPVTTEAPGGCGSMNLAAVAAIAVVALGSAVIVFKKK